MSLMKVFLFLSLLTTTAHSAASDDNATSVAITPEVSAVLLSPAYAQLVTALNTTASQRGQTLIISSLSNLSFEDGKVFVYINLSTRVSADFQAALQSHGQLVAVIQYGPMGEVIVESIYHKPAEVSPGGASVGN